MVITFLIGNGFDIRMGLKTSYKNFCDKVLKPRASESNNRVIKELCSDEENWSDMELYLGGIAINGMSSNEYYDNKIEIEELLKEYLLNEEAKITVKYSDLLLKEVKRTFCDFQDELKEVQKQRINGLKKSFANEEFLIQAINFNYTNTFDKAIEAVVKQTNGVINTHLYGGTKRPEKIGRVHHVNGLLTDGLVLGVNDPSQIKSTDLKQDEEVLVTTIKKRANAEKGARSTEIAESMIDESTLICVFGMSYGETDRDWWNNLCLWLNGSTNRNLVLFNYNPKSIESTNIAINRKNDQQILTTFKTASGVSYDVWKKIKDRIIVKEKPNLFNFPLELSTDNQLVDNNTSLEDGESSDK